ncbi:accessory gene regulator B family protein [Desulfosporosinus sp. OT]|uniref:accessory gene regulator ArgB-like protein n=1 Tax=Desulfosporosinus sp. OT TaxID=913865 RepID=UPI000223AB3A|nr:accessory gene regulator B family protein [Desulfosporosinus sp. OT]EGW36348.1 accessory gene regulator B family protein [Desulfosporosinus sp. OT]
MNINLSESFSNRLTNILTNELDYNEDKKEIIAYVIETLLLFVVGSFLIILSGYAFNALLPTVFAAISGGLLRRVSGGAHFNNPLKCLIFGSISYSLIGILSKQLVSYNFTHKYVLIFILLVSLFIVSFLAPVDSEAKPIHSSSLKAKLKTSSIVLVTVLFVLVSLTDNKLLNVSAVLGLAYQSLTLLPIFNR